MFQRDHGPNSNNDYRAAKHPKPYLTRNHHAKFKIDRTILISLN